MEAGDTSSAMPTAPWVERAPALPRDNLIQSLVEVMLEQRLQTAQHEVASGSCEDDESKVDGNEVLPERVPLDPRQRGDPTDHAMRERMHQRHQRNPRRAVHDLPREGSLALAQDVESRLARRAFVLDRKSTSREPASHRQWIEAEEESFGVCFEAVHEGLA